MINSGRWDYFPSVALLIPLKRFQMTLSMNYAVARCANESEWLLVITQETET